MKIITRHNDLIYYFFIPLAIIGFALIIFCQAQIALSFSAHWLLLLMIVILALTPPGKLRLGNEHSKPRFPWGIALAMIVLVELLLFLMFKGIVQLQIISSSYYPTLAQTNFVTLEQTLLIHWGLFPWALYGLLAIAFGYFGYAKNQKGIISITLAPLLKNKDEDAISIFADFCAKILINFAFILTFAVILLDLLIILSREFHIAVSTGIKPMLFLIGALLLALNSHSLWLRHFRSLSSKLRLIWSVCLYFILLISVLLGINLLANIIGHYAPSLYKVIYSFSPKNQTILWLILAGIWWCNWAGIISGFIAYVAKGHSIRSLVLMVLLLPLSFGLFINTHVAARFNSLLNGHNNLTILLAVIATFSLLAIITQRRYMSSLIRSTLPDTTPLKPRNTGRFLENINKNVLVMLILYLMGGIYLLTLFVFITTFYAIIVLGMVCISIMKTLYRKSNHLINTGLKP